VPTRNGDLIVHFDHHGESRQVVAFEFMPGQEPDESGDLSIGFEQLGRLTARLHDHAREWVRPPDFERKIWNFDTTLGAHPHWGELGDAPGMTSAAALLLGECVGKLRAELAAYGADADRFGLIHADLRLANLLVADEQLGVIDFDDCGFGWYMYDFAAAISFIETSPQIPALQKAWVAGYRSVRTLAADDENALPMFVMLRRLLLTAWIGSHAETPTAQALGGDYTQASIDLAAAWLRG
jgi:Ser/Thr protein kinase RdoA (MazF antagonist)